MAAMLLVLVVTSAALATRAAARALPAGAQQAASGSISTNNDAIPVPPATRSSTHWRGLQRLLLSSEEEKAKADHSCVTGDHSNGCP